MARKTDLMGMGINPIQARRMATDPQFVTSQGGSRASATQLGGDQYFAMVNASNAGGGLALPSVGGDNGALLGDDYIIHNFLAGNITIFGPPGSSLIVSGNTLSGSGGYSLASLFTATFWPVTASTFIGLVSA